MSDKFHFKKNCFLDNGSTIGPDLVNVVAQIMGDSRRDGQVHGLSMVEILHRAWITILQK